LFATVLHLNIDSPYGSVVDLNLLHHLAAMPPHCHRQPRQALEDAADVRAFHQDLEEIPTPLLTVQGKTNFLRHIGRVFFYVLKEFMNNTEGSSLPWYMSDLPEAFHQTLFDLQSLTMIFMENSGEDNFKLGVRITILHSTATTEKENTLLKFALQQLHSTCPPAQRAAGHVLIQWLWEHHYDSFGHFEDKHEVQSFYHIR